MARLKPVIHSPARLLQHHAVFVIDEVLLHGFGQRQQGGFHLGIVTYGVGCQESFGQVHQRVLQRPAAQARPVFIEAGLIQAVITGKTIGYHAKRSIQGRFDQLLAHLPPVVGAGKDDEGVGVQVLAAIQWLALGVDAVEPATMLGVVEVPLQRAEQRRCPFAGARLLDAAAEQIQLAGAGHGPIALYWQRLGVGVQGFIGQAHVGIPARTQPERHDALIEVSLDPVEQGRQFRLGGMEVGHGKGIVMIAAFARMLAGNVATVAAAARPRGGA
ncbi:hypothetical protein D3C77_409000 [compost metagenome]